MEREIFGHWSVGERGPVEGRLLVDDSGQIDLQLRGYLTEAARASGQLSDGSTATLFGVELIRRDPAADFREEYRIDIAVLGLDLQDTDERCLTAASCRLGGLEEVIGTSGLSIEVPSRSSKQKRFARVEWQGSGPIEMSLAIGTLSLMDFARFERESDFRYSLRHVAEARLRPEESLGLDAAAEVFDILAAFLAFAIEARVDLGSFLIHREAEPEDDESPGEVLTKHRPRYGKTVEEVEPWLTLRDLSNPEDALAGFYRFSHEQTAAYLILFELQVFFAALNPIDRLLYLARFLEVYHRTRFPGFRDPDDVQKEREALVKEALGKQHKAWGAHILRHSNEVFFKERIVRLLGGPAATALPVIGGTPTEFGRLVGDCRNYWTHYAPELESKALHDVELDQLNDRVLIVVRACVLDNIGVIQAEAVAALERDWRWRRYAGVPL